MWSLAARDGVTLPSAGPELIHGFALASRCSSLDRSVRLALRGAFVARTKGIFTIVDQEVIPLHHASHQSPLHFHMQFVRRAIRQVTLAPPFVGRRVGGPSRGFLPRARQQRGYPFLLGRPLAIMSTLRTKPASPSDVLDFWFGGHWGTENMADPQVLASQNPLWWGVSVRSRTPRSPRSHCLNQLVSPPYACSNTPRPSQADMTGPISPEEREQIDADCCTFVPLVSGGVTSPGVTPGCGPCFAAAADGTHSNCCPLRPGDGRFDPVARHHWRHSRKSGPHPTDSTPK